MSLPASLRKKRTQSCISVLALFSLQTENTSRSEKVRLYRHCSWWPHRGSLPRLHILLRQWFKPFLTAAAPLGLEGGCSGSTSLVAPPACPGADSEGSASCAAGPRVGKHSYFCSREQLKLRTLLQGVLRTTYHIGNTSGDG